MVDKFLENKDELKVNIVLMNKYDMKISYLTDGFLFK